MDKLEGRAWKFGDGISTDHITPGRYFHLRSNLPELAKHCLEDVRPEFVKEVEDGDLLVGGRNFGQGSSREHAPLTIKLTGVGAVIASSFARIFYRNCANVGLPAIIVPTEDIEDGDELVVKPAEGKLENRTKDFTLEFKPLPEIMQKILTAGGLVAYVKEHGGMDLE